MFFQQLLILKRQLDSRHQQRHTFFLKCCCLVNNSIEDMLFISWETNCKCQFFCGDRSKLTRGSIEPWLPEPMLQLSLLPSLQCQMMVNSAVSCTLLRFHTRMVALLNTALLEEVWTHSTRTTNTSTNASSSVRAACNTIKHSVKES